MRKFFWLPLLSIFLVGCSQTILEKHPTPEGVCVYETEYDFWGNVKKEIIVVCGEE